MAEKKEISFQYKVENTLASFWNKNRNILFITGIALIAILVIVIISLQVSSNRNEANMGKVDQLSEQYASWVALEDITTGEAVELAATLKTDLLQLAKNNSSYPSVKAHYLLGLIAFKEGSFDEAKTQFLITLDKGRKSYFASLSLFNLAVTSEQMNDTSGALDYYKQVYDLSNGEAAQSAKALFNVGRIHEENSDIDLAKAVFQQLSDEYPASEYAKLAKSKLVLL